MEKIIMVMKTRSFILAMVVLLSGCATGTHIVTGSKRPPTKPNQIVLYQVPPAKFEIVGIVNAQSPGHLQRNMDDTVLQLKQQAALIGANGILLGTVVGGSESIGVATGNGFGGGTAYTSTSVAVATTGIQLSGQAIYVEP